MKFQLPSIKQILQLFFTVLVCIAVGVVLLLLSFSIVPDAPVVKHVSDSKKVFVIEGVYPELDPSYTSVLDNYTDSIMLKKAAYDGTENAFQKVLRSLNWVLVDKQYEWPTDEFIAYYSMEIPEPRQTSAYARYWHGYLTTLRPLLALNNYAQIRALNLYIQMGLIILMIGIMIWKKCGWSIPAYLLSIFHISFLLIPYSLQYSTVLYLFNIACIILLLFNDKLKNNTIKYIFFTVVGAATSYYDFLTYPLVTFGMTAVLFICLNRDNQNLIDIRMIINILICWVAGYVGMWAGKWILASLFTNQNVIQDAIETISFRASGDAFGKPLSRIDAISKNIQYYENTDWSGFSIIVLGIEILILILFKNKMNWKMVLSCGFIAILPLGWYLMAGNHSSIHAFFTNKMLMMSTFSILCALGCWNPQKRIQSKNKTKVNKTKKK